MHQRCVCFLSCWRLGVVKSRDNISFISNRVKISKTHTQKKITQNEVFCWFEKHPICKYQPTASCSKAFLCMAKAVYIRWELTAKSNCHYKLLSLRRVLTFSFLLSYCSDSTTGYSRLIEIYHTQQLRDSICVKPNLFKLSKDF